ncbi:hypothetical protein J2Z48_001150 [Croceifilum oryzae]|uniref:Uncharacterized protein n=1 Tax=Croceifilum oryzae TaxID=1553429 RepID=A0AAJ1WS49_9BACL|nr:hypothetical protein [Croceifilum oryzae]MDQ0416978.1 hypothetical protein [Croceifilum oryzae]
MDKVRMEPEDRETDLDDRDLGEMVDEDEDKVHTEDVVAYDYLLVI